MNAAPYAMRDHDSAGRRHPEAPHPYRSEYQRDRDRIVHTKAFRRLENKTQVFDPEYSDHFRNRLTHSIEVSQISRTIGQALGLNPELCEVLALSHDIGHPPFSHEGERVLNEIMMRFGYGFDHNLHALRIVEYFEEKYPTFRGLNLTFEVREGIVKHSRDLDAGERLHVDLREYLPEYRPPLEAQLIDLADEVAYNTADLDDGFDSGLLELETVVARVTLFREIHRKVKAEFPGVPNKLRICETIRRMIDALVSDLFRNSLRTLERKGIENVEQVRAYPRRLLGFSHEMAEMNFELKRFLQEHLYEHEVLKSARRNVRGILEALFERYLRDPEKLPGGHYSRVPMQSLEQVVCDYIAGMTDKFAHARHLELGSQISAGRSS